MYKKIAVSMTMAALLCGISVFPASASAATPKEVTMHHHKPNFRRRNAVARKTRL